MSVLTYIAADWPMPQRLLCCSDTVAAGETPEEGPSDDDFFLVRAEMMSSIFTEKRCAVGLEWSGFSERRARSVIAYILELLRHTDEVELWHIWMGSEEKPLIRSRTISADALTTEEIRALTGKNVLEEFWEIPIQYRLVIRAE